MQKFLITFTSSNPITGEIMVTTSPRSTCPAICPLRRSLTNAKPACYAEYGHLGGFIWTGLDRTPAHMRFGNGIRVYNLAQLATVIRCLAPGSVWRHNQAGDLYADAHGTIDRHVLRTIVQANLGRRGFTFTHHDVLTNEANLAAIVDANASGFRINLSANNLSHADQLADLDIAPVAVVISTDQLTNTTTPSGRRVVVCPARIRTAVTFSTCQLCTRNRNVIISLPELTGRNNGIY